MTERKEPQKTYGFYVEVRAGQYEFATIVHASNTDTAGKIAIGRFDNSITEYQRHEMEDENGSIPAKVSIYCISNMQGAEKYWRERMLFQDNADGTYTCTDTKFNVVVRFPYWHCKEADVEAVPLFDKTTDAQVKVARHLAVVFVNTMYRRSNSAIRVVREGRQPCYKIEGVHEEFRTMRDVEKYIEDNGRGKAFDGRLINRVTRRNFMPMYIIRWDSLKEETIIGRL